MFGLGLQELIIILLIVIIIFGAKRIPEIMGGVGKGIKSFKKSMEETDSNQAAPPTTDTPPPPGPGSGEETPRKKTEP